MSQRHCCGFCCMESLLLDGDGLLGGKSEEAFSITIKVEAEEEQWQVTVFCTELCCRCWERRYKDPKWKWIKRILILRNNLRHFHCCKGDPITTRLVHRDVPHLRVRLMPSAPSIHHPTGLKRDKAVLNTYLINPCIKCCAVKKAFSVESVTLLATV